LVFLSIVGVCLSVLLFPSWLALLRTQ
jgi:hypothetical protein